MRNPDSCVSASEVKISLNLFVGEIWTGWWNALMQGDPVSRDDKPSSLCIVCNINMIFFGRKEI